MTPSPLRRTLLVTASVLAGGRLVRAQAQTLTISAAASLTDAFKELGPKFEAANPGLTLRLNFAASGVLIQQIRQGAPVDVFVSADEQTMSRGIDEHLLDGASRKDFATNTVVLVTPTLGAPALAQLDDLSRPEVRRIAIGKLETVPVGRYTKQGLEAAKLWTTLGPKYVYADSVRQVLEYVARGEVEAGFVYRTDAALMPDKVRIVGTLEHHTPVRYPAAVVADARNPVAAAAFVAYLLSPAAQAILAKYGFGRP
jgi:molybdate transport system substrate-binding protein